MNIARKLGLTVAAALLGASVVGIAAPAAHAGDSSWGCGGSCRPGR
ncbi:hypothetical protein [Nocardioides litoris]|nr:hypothetical protein [Nocardioides litoris]